MKIQDLCSLWGIPVNKIDGGVGNLSDGYHTFNDLYRQRLVLFAALCNTYPALAWKSRKHHDGQLCFGGGWFIVGLDTPQGQYTYHYEDKDWDLFKVEELEVGRIWDGHTDKDVERLLSLSSPIIGYDKGMNWDGEPDPASAVEEEESSMSSWAKREIEIACEREKKDANSSDEWDYGVACYESALKAYQSLCGDGHSGYSIGFTKNILNRLIDGQPLTPIEDTPDVWNQINKGIESDPYNTYQCKRMSSLFKYVYPDGTVKCKDVDSVYCISKDNENITYHSSLVQRLMDEMYPITMPYSPGKPIKVYCEDFLTDHANGDFDTVGILYAIKNDEKIEINKFFREGDTESDWAEIDKAEYDVRKSLAECLKAKDAAK